MNKLERLLIKKGDKREIEKQFKEIESAWNIIRYITHEKRGKEWLELEKEVLGVYKA